MSDRDSDSDSSGSVCSHCHQRKRKNKIIRAVVNTLEINRDNQDELDRLDEYTSLRTLNLADQIGAQISSPSKLICMFAQNYDHFIVETHEPDEGATHVTIQRDDDVACRSLMVNCFGNAYDNIQHKAYSVDGFNVSEQRRITTSTSRWEFGCFTSIYCRYEFTRI